MKAKKTIALLCAIALISVLGGCGSSTNSSGNSNEKIESNDSVAESKDEDFFIADEMFTDNVKKTNFIVFKSHDKYYETSSLSDSSSRVNSIDFNDGVEPLELNNGEFAIINADADILNGGIAGFDNKPVFTKIHNQEKLSLEDAISKLNIPELEDGTFSLATKIATYTLGNDVYLLFHNGSPIATTFDIYKNSEYLMSYEIDTPNEDTVSLKALIGEEATPDAPKES